MIHPTIRYLIAALLALSPFALASQARSDPPVQRIAVHLPNCPVSPFSYAEFERILQAQLAPENRVEIDSGSAPADIAAYVDIRCACVPVPLGAVIQVRTRAQPDRSRDVTFRDLPQPLWPRGLALATAELVRSSLHQIPAAAVPLDSSTPPTSPTPAVPLTNAPVASTTPPVASAAPPKTTPPTAPPTAPPPKATPPKQPQPQASTQTQGPPPPTVASQPKPAGKRKVFATAQGQMRLFGAPTTLFWGPRIGVRTQGFSGAVDWLTASPQGDLGTVQLTVLAFSLGVVAWSRDWGRWNLEVGPRLSAGGVFASGQAQGAVVSQEAREPYLDGAAQVDLRGKLSELAGFDLGLDFGGARGLIATEGQKSFAAAGGWMIGARIGLDTPLW